MATKHTANYQLNLWEPNDAFVRTEFNENSNKLDAALGALSTTVAEHAAAVTEHAANLATLNTEAAKGTWRMLKSETASSQVSRWNISVSDIDFHQYFEVVLDYNQEASATDTLTMLLNGKTSGYGPFASASGGVQYSSPALISLNRGNGGPSNIRVRFMPHLHNDLIHAAGYTFTGSGSWYAGEFNMISSTTFSQLSTVNLVGTVPAGSTVKIWGIK